MHLKKYNHIITNIAKNVKVVKIQKSEKNSVRNREITWLNLRQIRDAKKRIEFII